MSYAGRRVLVTGGLGFVGSNLAIRLAELGAQVTIVDALLPGLGGNPFNVDPVRDRVHVCEIDLRRPEGVDEIVSGQDVVFSLAGQVSHIDSMVDPLSDLEINCRTQLVVLEACRRAASDARFVFTGSRQQYGRPRFLPVTEEHPLDAIDVNGVHKTAAETAVLLYHRVYGLRACSLRLTNTYGPRMQMRHPRQGFVSWFVRRALDGDDIALFGDGASLRDFNYVEDVVEALLLVGAHDEAVGEVFNLGHPRPASLREFAETLLDVVGGGSIRSAPFPGDRARIDIGSIYADHGKLRALLGWEPRVDLRAGLERTVSYYRENHDRYW